MTEPVQPKQMVVTIHAVKNGYLVRAGTPWSRDSHADDDNHVFESFSALTAHLGRVMPNFQTPMEEVRKLATAIGESLAAPLPWAKRPRARKDRKRTK